MNEYFRVKSAQKSTNSPYVRSISEADPLVIETFNLFAAEEAHVQAKKYDLEHAKVLLK